MGHCVNSPELQNRRSMPIFNVLCGKKTFHEIRLRGGNFPSRSAKTCDPASIRSRIKRSHRSWSNSKSEIFTSNDADAEVSRGTVCRGDLSFSTIPAFELPELRQAPLHMRSRRSGDDADWVLELFKLGCAELHECLLDIYSRMLVAESLEPSWQPILFSRCYPNPVIQLRQTTGGILQL